MSFFLVTPEIDEYTTAHVKSRVRETDSKDRTSHIRLLSEE